VVTVVHTDSTVQASDRKNMTTSMPISILALPVELLQHITSHLHSTYDIISLSCANKSLYAVLFNSAIFEQRIRDGGWDTVKWNAKLQTATHGRKGLEALTEPTHTALLPPTPNGSVEYWQRASIIHDEAAILLREASSPYSGFSYPTDIAPFSKPGFQLWYPRWCFTDWGATLIDCGVDPYPTSDPLREGNVRFINGSRVFEWFMKFGDKFESLLRHHGMSVLYS